MDPVTVREAPQKVTLSKIFFLDLKCCWLIFNILIVCVEQILKQAQGENLISKKSLLYYFFNKIKFNLESSKSEYLSSIAAIS